MFQLEQTIESVWVEVDRGADHLSGITGICSAWPVRDLSISHVS